MIESIEFHVSGQKNTITYDRKAYLSYLDRKKNEYVGNHFAIKQWFIKEKKIESVYKEGIPTFNWDGIAFITNDHKTIIICNPDASIKFKISVPEKLIQIEDYKKNLKLTDCDYSSIEDYSSQYKMKFTRFDDYFEYEGKHYLAIKVGKYLVNNEQYAFLQMRYLDCETGEFLPFTKTISRYIENQYSYNEETFEL